MELLLKLLQLRYACVVEDQLHQERHLYLIELSQFLPLGFLEQNSFHGFVDLPLNVDGHILLYIVLVVEHSVNLELVVFVHDSELIVKVLVVVVEVQDIHLLLLHVLNHLVYLLYSLPLLFVCFLERNALLNFFLDQGVMVKQFILQAGDLLTLDSHLFIQAADTRY